MIEIQDLTKFFGSVTAVGSLTLSVPAGTILGLIGPNGAGKTTTLRMLAALLPPDHGTATIAGLDLIAQRREVRAALGYMPSDFGVYPRVSVDEYIDFFAAAHGLLLPRRAALIGDMLELVDLTSKRTALVETLSRGMKQRLCLATALLHNPQVLLLDEPAAGVDPRSRFEMRALLLELQGLGKTIIVSSHVLSELEEVCSHVAIIERGQLVSAGPIGELARAARGGDLRRLTIELGVSAEPLAGLLRDWPQVRSVECSGHTAVLLYAGGPEDQQALLAMLVGQGIPVRTFAEEETSLEDVYLQTIRNVEEAE